MTYNIWCLLLGNKWYKWERVYEPHYLKLVELGLATTCLPVYDHHLVKKPSDICDRCSLSKLEAGITSKEHGK